MTIDWASAIPVTKPWGKMDLRPWSPLGRADQAVGEIHFRQAGTDGARPALLLKLLFTAEALSIQVHPDDASARAMGLASGKSEAWYILDAAEGARVGLGLAQPLDAATLRTSVIDGRSVEIVDWRPVRTGDFLSVPAGTIHALGAGLVVAEIQQNSDVTFRLHDYGSARTLHIEEGLAAARIGPLEPQVRPRRLTAARSLLLEAPEFIVEMVVLAPGSAWRLDADQETWLLVIGGSARFSQRVAGRGEALRIAADAVDIAVGSEELKALIAYTGPLQAYLVETASDDGLRTDPLCATSRSADVGA